MNKIFFEDSKGHQLCGILSNSKIDKEKPMIILCHGLHSNKDSYTNIRLEKILNENEISTFRFDFFAHSESEGNFDDTSIDEFVDNILGSIKYLKNLGYSKIGLCGASFGAVAAVIATSKINNILLLALKSPGMGQTSRKMMQFKNDFNNKIWFTAGKKIYTPTLIIHGDADKDVELQQGIKLSESIKNSRMEIIKGADHTYSNPKDFEEMIKLISKFIIDICKGH